MSVAIPTVPPHNRNAYNLGQQQQQQQQPQYALSTPGASSSGSPTTVVAPAASTPGASGSGSGAVEKTGLTLEQQHITAVEGI
ncbi:hypothetical protein FRC00_012021, partial [Tulasnella sp. 408]